MGRGGSRNSIASNNIVATRADTSDELAAAKSIYDPASIGGMASLMQEQGTITRELARTAERFDATRRYFVPRSNP
jgi:hypothetical protein